MTLNDSKPSKKGVLVFFLQFSGVTHISKVNCAEMARDRPGQPAYEIFSIERTFLATQA